MPEKWNRLRAYYRTKRAFQAGAAYLPWVRKRLRKTLHDEDVSELVRTDGDLVVRVNSNEPATYNVLVRGVIDPEMDWVIHRYVKPGTAAMDVGANIGLISALIGARLGDGGKVYAVEPNQNLHGRIREAFHLNAMRNLQLCHCACSAKPGKAGFSVDPEDHTKSMISESGSEEIDLLPVDTILKDESRPLSFLKIDVEGHEAMVLAGARATLRTHKPTLVFETGTHEEEELGKIKAILDEVGYEVLGVIHEWGIDEKPLTVDITTRTHCDVIALPRRD